MKVPSILTIPTLSNADWKDNDVVMLHACFCLLEDCIENEKLLTGDIDWEHDKELQGRRDEIQALYDWWKERKKVGEPSLFVPDEKDKYERDDEMLVRLIKIRRYLWT